MRRVGLRIAPLLFLTALARSGDIAWSNEPVRCAAIECEAPVPEGWTVADDRSGFSAMGADKGFVVSREPCFLDSKGFGDAWAADIERAGQKAKVQTVRAGRYQGWSADWEVATTAGNRTIRAVRLYVPDAEMVYNFSFSAASAAEIDPVSDGVLKGFRWTGEKPKLVFSQQTIGEGRITVRLPEGYEALPREVRLGVGGGAGYAKVIPGYAEPHTAGLFTLLSFDSRMAYPLSDGSAASGTDLKGLAEGLIRDALPTLGTGAGKPRGRIWKCGKEKAYCMEASLSSKSGLPLVCFVATSRFKGYTYVFQLVVDEREERLYKDLFRDLCGEMEFKE